MACNAGPKIVNDGLVLALDAGNTKSYSTFITYVGGTSDSDNSSSFTLSGLQSGDLVLYFSAEDGTLVNTPTGENWTAIPGLGAQPDNDENPSSAAFYVFAAGTSVTASGLAAGNNHVRVMIAFRNVDSTNPFDVNATQNSSSFVLPNPPSITPVTNNSMIVAVGLQDDEDIANSISPPTGYTTAVIMDSQGGANNAGVGGATIMTAYKLLETAAAEDPGAFTSSNGSASDPNKGISIALRSENSKEVVNPLTWTDLVGSGIGTLTNGPTFDSGNGGSIVFDGTNDYVDCGSSDDFAFGTGDYTIEVWCNPDTQLSDVLGRGLISISPDLGDDLSNWQIRYNGSGNITFLYSGGNSITSSSSVSTGEWTQIVATRIGTALTLYINAVSEATGTSSANLSDNGILRIGTRRNLDADYDGKIPIVRLYKGKALSQQEIKQNYDAHRRRYGI